MQTFYKQRLYYSLATVLTDVTHPESSTEGQYNHGKEDNNTAYFDDHLGHIRRITHLLGLLYGTHEEEGAAKRRHKHTLRG